MQRNGILAGVARACFLFLLACALAVAAPAQAAPYAAMVIDARSGKVLHSRNADTRLHPASLTKMMTLYIAFEAVQNGELTMDTMVTISRKAAAEPPSKLGLRPGQRIKLRYLVRAAAVRSANDAATAIGEAISGSEAAFARRMNRTARSLGMTNTTFKNAHGLTQSGHLSTARDMTTMGRALFYHYPQYYNLFSRRSTDAGVKTVYHTNRRFLSSYRGTDGIKTGYTRAAGFNLTSSAERNGERIIATIFGGNSTATRNARMAELLDMGFQRAPRRVAVNAPPRPAYQGNDGQMPGKSTRVVRAVAKSLRPIPRPGPAAPPPEVLLALQEGIAEAVSLAAAQEAETPEAGAPVVLPADAADLPAPAPRPDSLPETVVAATEPDAEPAPEAVVDGAAVSDVVADLVMEAAGVTEAAGAGQADMSAQDATAPEAGAETQPALETVAAASDASREAGATAAPITLLSLATAPDGMRARPVLRPDEEKADVAVGRTSPDLPGVGGSPALPVPRPMARPLTVTATERAQPYDAPPPVPTRVVTRAASTQGPRGWHVSLGAYPTRFAAEQALLEAALREMSVLEGARREVVRGARGFEARFQGLSEIQAQRTCGRMAARGASCQIAGAG